MSKFARTLIASCEGLDDVIDPELVNPDAPVVVEEEGVPVTDTTEQDVADVVEEAGDIDGAGDGVEELEDTVTSLESIRDQLIGIVAAGQYTPAVAEAVHNHVADVTARVGLRAPYRASVEGITDSEVLKGAGEVALEGIGESIKNAGKAVWAGLLSLINKVIAFFSNLGVSAKSLKERANALVVKAQAMKKDPEGKISNGRLFGQLSQDGTTVKPAEAVKVSVANYKRNIDQVMAAIAKLGGEGDVADTYKPAEGTDASGASKNLDIEIDALSRNEIQTIGREVVAFAEIVLADKVAAAAKKLKDTVEKLAKAGPQPKDAPADNSKKIRNMAATLLTTSTKLTKKTSQIALAGLKVAEISLGSKAAEAK